MSTQAAQRSARGTFATELPRDNRAVAEIVKRVTEIASDRLDKDPTDVTEAEWNDHRDRLIGYGPIPKIHGLLAQLPDRHGKPYAYRKLLRDIFDEERSFEHVARERVGVDDWPDLDLGHIDYGLNRVADFAGVTSFTPGRYDVLRDEVIRAERRRHKTGVDLGRRLPTSEQILRFYEGDWDRALLSHGLEVEPSESYRARAVRVPEAIVRFYVTTGFLPTNRQLSSFARYFQFSRENWKRKWLEALAEGRAAIREAGLAAPPPYRPRVDKPVWEDAHGSRPWDVADAPYRPKHFWTTKGPVLAKVAEFIREEVGPRRPASQDRYQAWSALSPERPSLEIIQKFGGLKALVKEAAGAESAKRAQQEARRRANPSAKEIKAAAAAKLAANIAKPQCQSILRLIEERGEMGAREIEAALGWGKSTAGNWLPILREAGLIVCTTPSPVARNARYRLPGELTAEQVVAAERRQKEELLLHPNGQVARQLLEERGEVTSAEVAEAAGCDQGTARVWLNRLVELDYATRHFEGIKGQIGGRRVVYRAIETSWFADESDRKIKGIAENVEIPSSML